MGTWGWVESVNRGEPLPGWGWGSDVTSPFSHTLRDRQRVTLEGPYPLGEWERRFLGRLIQGGLQDRHDGTTLSREEFGSFSPLLRIGREEELVERARELHRKVSGLVVVTLYPDSTLLTQPLFSYTVLNPQATLDLETGTETLPFWCSVLQERLFHLPELEGFGGQR